MLGVRGGDGPLADAPRRAPMQWSDGPGAGFTTETPWEPLQANYAEANVAREQDDGASLLSLYRRLIHLHTSTAALAHGSFAALKSSDDSVAAFVRQQGDEAVLVLLNFGRRPVEGANLALEKSALPPGVYQPRTLLDDDISPAPLTVSGGGTIAGYVPLPSLPPRSGYIFQLAPRR